jgi:hypothetical protein
MSKIGKVLRFLFRDASAKARCSDKFNKFTNRQLEGVAGSIFFSSKKMASQKKTEQTG